MTTYVIGEIKSGYRSLQRLMNAIQFDKAQDVLWFTGDLVDQGEDSLSLLRFVKELGKSAITVLGDRDLKLLAIAEGFAQPEPNDIFGDILNAPDRDELLRWLRQCPLMHYDAKLKFVLVHAGIPAEWSLSQASTFAFEAETALSFGNYKAFLENISANPPRRWHAKLRGWKRLQFIVSAFTRMRYCNEKGYMDFSDENPKSTQEEEYVFWYRIPNRATAGLKIAFGHWPAPEHEYYPNIYPLNTSGTKNNSHSILKISPVMEIIRVPYSDCSSSDGRFDNRLQNTVQ